MSFVADVDRPPQPLSPIQQDHVQQRLCHRIRAPPPPRHQPHGPVAVPREPRLAEGLAKLNGADAHDSASSPPPEGRGGTPMRKRINSARARAAWRTTVSKEC